MVQRHHNNRLDARVALQGLIDWYIAEKDQTSSSIGRSLQAYLDTLDCSPYLKEIETPTLLLVGEESPTSTLDQQRFMQDDCKVFGHPLMVSLSNHRRPSFDRLRTSG